MSRMGDGSNLLSSSSSILVLESVKSRSFPSPWSTSRKAAWTAESSLAKPGKKALAHTILVPYAALPMMVKMAVKIGVKVCGEVGNRSTREQVMDPV